MSRAKEYAVVVLDVGPAMAPYLPHAVRALCTLLADKLNNRPTHVMAIVLLGTSDTNNPLNTEMAQSGEEGQYMNVVVAAEMSLVDKPHLKALQDAAPAPEGTPSDLLDGLMVALDLLGKTLPQDGKPDKHDRRIILVSNLLGGVSPDDDMVKNHVLPKLQKEDVMLDFVHIDERIDAGGVANGTALTTASDGLTLINQLCGALRHRRRRVATAAQLAGVFKAKDYGTQSAYYSGVFNIAPGTSLDVKLVKKVGKEKLPPTAAWSGKSIAEDATHGVVRSLEYRARGNPNEEVEPGDRVRAYPYGRDKVPFPKEMEEELQYPPKGAGSSLDLVGFLPADAVPRYYYMSDVWVVVPDKGKRRTHAGFSALVRAMHRRGQVAIVRYLSRDAISLCAASPLLGGDGGPDSLTMVHLPFKEDLRTYQFPTFSSDKRPEIAPTEEQLSVARRLVQNMNLSQGGHELLQPDSTPNPALHRFLDAAARRGVDELAPLPPPEADPLTQQLLGPPLPALPAAAAEALAALPAAFPLKPTGGQAAPAIEQQQQQPAARLELEAPADASAELGAESAVEAVGTSAPVADFQAMVRAGRGDEAVSGMQAAIQLLVENALSEKSYPKPLEAVRALREDAIARSLGAGFNSFLSRLADRFEHDQYKAGFWRLLTDAGITLISDDEAGQLVGTSAQAAADFLAQHSAQRQDAPETGQTKAEPSAEEDELEDME